jgi:dCMP deaminase
MKKEKYMSWDTYFMSIAVLSSFRSKDSKTQNGACIVNSQKKVVGVGYNGMPRGLDDSDERFWNDSDDSDIINSKHSYVVHAEANAIYNKNYADISGGTLYVTCFPCRECAKAIIQNGIKKVVYQWIKEKHVDINKTVEIMFNESGVEFISYDELDINDSEYILKLSEMKKFYE